MQCVRINSFCKLCNLVKGARAIFKGGSAVKMLTAESPTTSTTPKPSTGRLAHLEVENFKSYYGKQIIGPFDDNFVCVIGPNGAGKSNVMDALSFVLGLQSGSLRSHQLVDLIYRRGESGGEEHTVSKPIATNASVTAVYRRASGEQVRFTRRINGSGHSEYRINGRPLSYAEYVKVWEGENVLIRARNFLVFQGDVEALANKSPRDLTRLLEQISGSDEWKEEWEQCRTAVERAEDEVAQNSTKRKGVSAELKLVQDQRADVLRYEQLQDQRTNLQGEYYLWKLYHLEEAGRRLGAEIEEQEQAVEQAATQVRNAEKTWTETKKAHAIHQKALLNVEKRLKTAQKALQVDAPTALQLEEHCKFLQDKVRSLQGAQERAHHDLQGYQRDREIARKEAQELAQALSQLEKEAEERCRMASVALTAPQQREYEQLKEDVRERTARERLKLESLQRKLAPQLAERQQWVGRQEELWVAECRLAAEVAQLEKQYQEVLLLDEFLFFIMLVITPIDANYNRTSPRRNWPGATRCSLG